MSAPYWDIPYLWEHLALPSAPFPWDFDTAVKRVQSALDELGGIEGLRKHEMPARYIMASNWVYARELEALGANPTSHKWRASLVIRAKRESEAWDAMVLIIGMSTNGHFDDAYRTVKRTIGERPGEKKGNKDKNQRNTFIYDWIDILQHAGGLTLTDTYSVIAEALKTNSEVIRKGKYSYERHLRALGTDRLIAELASGNSVMAIVNGSLPVPVRPSARHSVTRQCARESQ